MPPLPGAWDCITMSAIGVKSVFMPRENSKPGDTIGGEDTNGECTSCMEAAPPTELEPSVLKSSNGRYCCETIPALPKPSKISMSQAVSGGDCNIGLAKRGKTSWTLTSNSGAKRCSPMRSIARIFASWCKWSRGLAVNGFPDDGIMVRTSVRSLVMVMRDSICKYVQLEYARQGNRGHAQNTQKGRTYQARVEHF